MISEKCSVTGGTWIQPTYFDLLTETRAPSNLAWGRLNPRLLWRASSAFPSEQQEWTIYSGTARTEHIPAISCKLGTHCSYSFYPVSYILAHLTFWSFLYPTFSYPHCCAVSGLETARLRPERAAGSDEEGRGPLLAAAAQGQRQGALAEGRLRKVEGRGWVRWWRECWKWHESGGGEFYLLVVR